MVTFQEVIRAEPCEDGSSSSPSHIVVAGDWHGNTKWAVHVIRNVVKYLPAEQPRVILHLGDFGVWPNGDDYIKTVSRELEEAGTYLLFVDGNHEDHSRLAELHASDPGPVPVDTASRIWHLPRGTRWSWYGRTWLAIGGAGSPDWKARIEGVSWWPEEVLTQEQADSAADGVWADILIAHDCPADFMPLLPPPPHWWDLTACRESSRALQTVVDRTAPELVLHGHLHRSRDDTFATSSRPVRVIGLDMDGEPGNWVVLRLSDLEMTRW